MEEQMEIVETIRRGSVSAEEWEREWRRLIAREQDDTRVTTSYAQFRANVPSPDNNTYLCVHDDGSVCIDGKPTQSNTIFRLAHVFFPNTNYYQIICKGGSCVNYILYVDRINNERKLKARPYDKDVDSLKNGYSRPTPTLFKFQDVCDTNLYIAILDDQSYHFTVNSTSHVMLRANSPDDISFEHIIVQK